MWFLVDIAFVSKILKFFDEWMLNRANSQASLKTNNLQINSNLERYAGSTRKEIAEMARNASKDCTKQHYLELMWRLKQTMLILNRENWFGNCCLSGLKVLTFPRNWNLVLILAILGKLIFSLKLISLPTLSGNWRYCPIIRLWCYSWEICTRLVSNSTEKRMTWEKVLLLRQRQFDTPRTMLLESTYSSV